MPITSAGVTNVHCVVQRSRFHCPSGPHVAWYTTPGAVQPNQQPADPGRQLPGLIASTLPPQPVAPGLQTASHSPTFTGAVSHASPVELQVRFAPATHSVFPGVQIALQAPAVIDPLNHNPSTHDCGVVPMQRIWPGVQTAPHCEAWIMPSRQVPCAVQVRGTVPKQPFVFGLHSPVQLP